MILLHQFYQNTILVIKEIMFVRTDLVRSLKVEFFRLYFLYFCWRLTAQRSRVKKIKKYALTSEKIYYILYSLTFLYYYPLRREQRFPSAYFGRALTAPT